MERSSIGCKIVMAVTGLLLIGFVVGHMLGNLQIFFGRDVLNGYAAKLHEMPGLLWTVRLGLLTVFCVHIVTSLLLAKENRSARPIGYVREDTVRASVASRYMVLSGLVILVFVIYHVLHFTMKVFDPEYKTLTEIMPDGSARPDVYAMLIRGFSNPVICAVYVLAQILLGLHLSHGASSVLQTLGVHCSCCQRGIEAVGPICAAIIVVGNVSIPIAVLSGIVTMPPTAAGGM